MDVTVAELESGNVSGEFSVWIGVDMNGCLYVGQEDVPICSVPLACDTPTAYRSIASSPERWVDILQEVIDWVENHPTVVLGSLGLVALAVAAIFIGPVVAVVLGAAGLVATGG